MMFELLISYVRSRLGGIALVLFGMALMGEGLKKVAGSRLAVAYTHLQSHHLLCVHQILGTAKGNKCNLHVVYLTSRLFPAPTH